MVSAEIVKIVSDRLGLPRHIITAYINDTYILGPTEGMAAIVMELRKEFSKVGLEFNMTKLKMFSLSTDCATDPHLQPLN